MPKRKTEFWWASIHGADPEPIEKTEHEGRPCVYTLGCADPFYLDEPGVLLIDPRSNEYTRPEAMERPRHPDKIAAEKAAIRKAEEKGALSYVNPEGKRVRFQPRHGWRGPR